MSRGFLQLLQDIHIDCKDVQVIRNLYWEQEAAVHIENDLTEWIYIMRGFVKDACNYFILYILHYLYSEDIMRNIEELNGFKIGGQNLNNLRFADDTELIATSEELQQLLDVVVEASRERGLDINCDKTKSLVVSTSKRSTNM